MHWNYNSSLFNALTLVVPADRSAVYSSMYLSATYDTNMHMPELWSAFIMP